jgi:nodulation protein E
MNDALDDARLPREQITYVNAHGTGTVANDSTETRALRQVFGSHADSLAVSSTKSMHGHALAQQEPQRRPPPAPAQFIPPTANFLELDPACDLDVVPNEARAAQIEAALSNSFAFGGLNAVLAFRCVQQ